MSTGTVPETSFMSPVYGCALICRRQKQKLLRRDEQEKARRITGYLNEHQSKDKSPVKVIILALYLHDLFHLLSQTDNNNEERSAKEQGNYS